MHRFPLAPGSASSVLGKVRQVLNASYCWIVALSFSLGWSVHLAPAATASWQSLLAQAASNQPYQSIHPIVPPNGTTPCQSSPYHHTTCAHLMIPALRGDKSVSISVVHVGSWDGITIDPQRCSASSSFLLFVFLFFFTFFSNDIWGFPTPSSKRGVVLSTAQQY